MVCCGALLIWCRSVMYFQAVSRSLSHQMTQPTLSPWQFHHLMSTRTLTKVSGRYNLSVPYPEALRNLDSCFPLYSNLRFFPFSPHCFLWHKHLFWWLPPMWSFWDKVSLLHLLFMSFPCGSLLNKVFTIRWEFSYLGSTCIIRPLPKTSLDVVKSPHYSWLISHV